MFGSEAIHPFKLIDWKTCLDIGSGTGVHSKILNDVPDRDCYSLDSHHSSDFKNNYLDEHFTTKFDAVWCCHVLEHQPNVHEFIQKIMFDVKPDGPICITVPPMKPEIVGGHLTLWNRGLLAYNLIAAGLDLTDAKIWQYGDNISALFPNIHRPHVELSNDSGDINALAPYFPRNWGVEEGFNGDNP